jgi:predicted ester cyclase
MSLESDLAAMCRIPLEAFEHGNLEVIDEVVSPDYVENVPLPPGSPTGIAGLKGFITGLRSAFPDLHYEILKTVSQGDTHVLYTKTSGTMKGDFQGMPASGKRAAWDEVHIARVAEGKLAEHSAVYDQLGMLQQLGFVPVP